MINTGNELVPAPSGEELAELMLFAPVRAGSRPEGSDIDPNPYIQWLKDHADIFDVVDVDPCNGNPAPELQMLDILVAGRALAIYDKTFKENGSTIVQFYDLGDDIVSITQNPYKLFRVKRGALAKLSRSAIDA